MLHFLMFTQFSGDAYRWWWVTLHDFGWKTHNPNRCSEFSRQTAQLKWKFVVVQTLSSCIICVYCDGVIIENVICHMKIALMSGIHSLGKDVRIAIWCMFVFWNIYSSDSLMYADALYNLLLAHITWIFC